MNLTFVENYIKLIVSNPDDILIKRVKVNDSFYLIKIYAKDEDVGRIIGKGGNMINAIKSMVWLCKLKNQSKISYKIEVTALDK